MSLNWALKSRKGKKPAGKGHNLFYSRCPAVTDSWKWDLKFEKVHVNRIDTYLIKERGNGYTRCICVFKQTCLQDVRHLCLIYIDKNCVNDEVFFVYVFYHHVMCIKNKQITHTHTHTHTRTQLFASPHPTHTAKLFNVLFFFSRGSVGHFSSKS